jgi:hypothetical protein
VALGAVVVGVSVEVTVDVLVVGVVLVESPLSPPPQPTANTVNRAPPNSTKAVRGVEFIGEPLSVAVCD